MYPSGKSTLYFIFNWRATSDLVAVHQGKVLPLNDTSAVIPASSRLPLLSNIFVVVSLNKAISL